MMQQSQVFRFTLSHGACTLYLPAQITSRDLAKIRMLIDEVVALDVADDTERAGDHHGLLESIRRSRDPVDTTCVSGPGVASDVRTEDDMSAERKVIAPDVASVTEHADAEAMR